MRSFLLATIGIIGCASLVNGQTLESQLLQESLGDLAKAAREFGDAKRGAILFHQPTMACTKCHAIGGREKSLGPDLTKLPQDVTNAHIVESVLQPSKVIRKGYEATTVLLTDGRTMTGLQAKDDPTIDAGSIALRDPTTNQIMTFAADDIDEQVVSPQSIMPQQQVNQLASRQQFLDLIAYLIAIRDGGAAKARELQPPAELFALKLPEYESRVDHAGLLRDLDDESFRRGQAIYERLCINCHGDHDKPGSLPTALRFAEGKFKNGNDPFTMYQTLTRGFGFMVPQPWMVPQQKYDVIHYIRRAYLKEHNPSQHVAITEDYLASLPQGDTKGPKPRKYEPWSDMNYGPQLVGTYEIPGGAENIAYKGIAVRLDAGAGGVSRGNAWMVFDHDTLRVAGAWTATEGGQLRFIDWQGITFNGRHGQHPTAIGDVLINNPTGPGWANPQTGSFEDDQRVIGRDGKHYGPLPRDWGQFHGFYAHEEKTVIDYTVGDANILEMPGMITVGRVSNPSETHDGQDTYGLKSRATDVMTRSFNVGPRSQMLTLLVATHADESAKLTMTDRIATLAANEDQAKQQTAKQFDGTLFLQREDTSALNMEDADFTITARIRTSQGGAIFAKTEPGDEWVPGGKVFFVRGGRLCYDTGWVGVVQSRQRVDDGKWHDVAVTRESGKGLVRLYIDGKLDGKRKLAAGEDLESPVVRIGYCAPDFPAGQSMFDGELQDVRFIDRVLADDELSNPVPAEALIAHWPLRLDRQNGIEPDPFGRDESGQKRHMAFHDSGTSAQPRTVVAGLSTDVDGASWRADDGRLLLDIEAGEEPLKFVLWSTSTAALFDESRLTNNGVQFEEPQPDLSQYTHGGKPRWPERVTTQVAEVGPGGAFAIDELTRPSNNPWLARTRLTGLDFFDNPDRMVVTSWDGDVWLVTFNANPDRASRIPQQLTWQRIASGLFQPLGVKVVDGDIYVTCRDQLVILRDKNDDGETDFYECFNNDHQVTEHFHEFAMGLQTDDVGNFYYAKSARHALTALVPHHGTLLRVTPDGERTDILANGFRAANGVCLNPDGTFIVTDQEGHWNPKNRINWVTPGIGTDTRFYGNMFGYHDVTDDSDEAMEPPLCWITNAFDRSPSELLWVDSAKSGGLSMGRCSTSPTATGKCMSSLTRKLTASNKGACVCSRSTSFPPASCAAVSLPTMDNSMRAACSPGGAVSRPRREVCTAFATRESRRICRLV